MIFDIPFTGHHQEPRSFDFHFSSCLQTWKKNAMKRQWKIKPSGLKSPNMFIVSFFPPKMHHHDAECAFAVFYDLFNKRPSAMLWYSEIKLWLERKLHPFWSIHDRQTWRKIVSCCFSLELKDVLISVASYHCRFIFTVVGGREIYWVKSHKHFRPRLHPRW